MYSMITQIFAQFVSSFALETSKKRKIPYVNNGIFNELKYYFFSHRFRWWCFGGGGATNAKTDVFLSSFHGHAVRITTDLPKTTDLML